MSNPEANLEKGDGKNSEDISRGTKRAAEVKVHTANDWEHAHLEGGEDRKLKFLRLMGASKKEHSGPILIGEPDSQKQHGRSEKEEMELESKLEKQFETNLEYKLKGGVRRHKGLGFEEVEEENDSQKETVKATDETPQSEKEKREIAPDEAEQKPVDSQEQRDEDNKPNVSDASKKYVMSFVKESS